MLKIIIADDHQIVRRGLRMTIEAEKDLKVLAEAVNGTEVLALIKKQRMTIWFIFQTYQLLKLKN